MGWWMVGGACFCTAVRAASREAHPLWAVFSNAVCGVAALAAVNATGAATGVFLPLNPVSGFLSVVLGLPGVVLMLMLNLL